MKLNKIKSVSIASEVFDQLRIKIINGELKNGERLVEMELANHLGVSRTPVREAIQRLEQEGLVEILPRKHCLVKGITFEAINEIILIRSLLEPKAAKVAASKITDEQLLKLKNYLEQSQVFFQLGKIDDLMKIHDLFHAEIIKSSGLNRLVNILENLHDYIVHFRFSFLSRPHLVERSIKEHFEIYEALCSRDEERVEEVFIKHLSGISDYAKVVLEDNSPLDQEKYKTIE
ncbi:GntR family transcriptional regulator [Cytobacillus purgationiresistens]|uniref:DNA-binding GntR family transcriptional regulator n=1 Tax=Cytobacillus purgationiresistens TaxID=863449 RepID=A0ABU0AKD6_9BACI|nr:GntR family transcriptional regulator [Cytobacillus purgationiresistens]MDQ0271723.1 DNA-binding GntR family transcriptional regulator [Cytobacillus purgationiresistens]